MVLGPGAPAQARPRLGPGPGRSEAATPRPAATGQTRRRSAASLSPAWAKAFHPRHASRGVLALRGAPLLAPTRPSSPRATRPGARKQPSCPGPGAPGGVSAKAGTNQAAVTWSAASGNGNTVDAYVVREATGPQAGTSVAVDGSATTATLTGLSGGTAATFSVTAESTCGNGPAGTSPAATPAGSATTYLSTVLSGKPAALYRLDEPGGGVMADSSGNKADGAYSGQQTLGRPAALASDPAPSAGYTSCCSGIGSANPAMPRYNAARTVEAWVSTTSATISQAIVGYGQTSTDEAFVVSVSAQAIGVDAYNDYLWFPTPRPVDDGNWHLITATYGAGTVDVYLDGQEVGDAPFSGTPNTLDLSGVSLAAFPGYNVFNGNLADVAVYSSALSPAQVTAQFTASGYSRPSAAQAVSAFYGGPNAANVTWGHATASGVSVAGYLVTALGGPSVSVPGDATAARLTGLAAGSHTFQVTAVNQFGGGPPTTTKALTVTGTASTYASTVLAAGPAVFYRLADGDPAAMTDSSSAGATGTYSGAASLGQPGPLANDPAASVGDNGNGPVAAGNPALPLYAQPRTVEGWVDTTSGGVQWLAAYGNDATTQGFTVGVQGASVLVSGYNDDLSFARRAPLNDGAWHFIVVTANGTSATAYADGVSLGTQSFAQTLDTVPGSSGLEIGSGVLGCCGSFSGALADVAVFPAALTAAQVAGQFAASGLGPPPAPGSPTATAGANQATVSWSAPSAGSAVSGYLVTAVKGSTTGNAVSVPAGATTAKITGLAGGTAYTFKVQALNEYGAGTAAVTAAVTPTGVASTYASTVLAAGPSAFYRLADGDPGAMADSSGNGVTGTYTSAASLGQPGPLANDTAASVGDNGNGPVASGDPVLPWYAQPRTVEGWVDTTGGGQQWLAGYGAQNTTEGFGVAVQGGNVYVTGYNDDLSFASPAPLNDGAWHFVVVTSTGTSATVYVDGASLGTQSFSQTLDTLPGPLLIGADAQGCCGSFSGALADVAVFPAALTAAQVAAQFAASGLGRLPAPGSPTVTAGANEATVSWSAPSGGSAVSGYLLTAMKGSTAVNAVSLSARETSTSVTGLAAGTAYTFKIQALTEYGAGAAAVTSAVTPTGTASTYAATVLAADPAVFYRLADGDRAAMADSSGKGVTGTYSGAASLGQPGPLASDPAGSVGDNGNGPVASGNPVLPWYAQPRTVEGWVDTTGGGQQWLAGYGIQNTTEGFGVAVQGGNVYVTGYNDDLSFSANAPVNDGSWHFVVVTSNGKSATAYVDGVSLGTRSFTHMLDTLPGPLLIGADAQGCCGSFSGALADVAVFPAALTAAQVAAQFAASGLGRPPAPGSPKATALANQATVSWSASSGGSPAVSGYLVTAMKGSTAVNAVSVPARETSTSVTGLAGGTVYTFQIQALNEYGAGTAAVTAAVTPTGTASTYAATVLAASPSVFYRLADDDPGAMADSSGHGATGIYTSAATLEQTGPLAGDPAASVGDNGNGPVASGTPALPWYAQPRTVEGWVNFTNGGQDYVAGYGVDNTAQGFGVAVQGDTVFVTGYSDDLSFTGKSATNDGNWHFIVVTSNGTSATAYVDGVSLGTQSFAQTLDTLPGPLLIGADAQGCCGSLSGELADVAVFPTALSAAQVAAQYTAAKTSGASRQTHPRGPARSATAPATAPSRKTGGRS
jgi:hypothetical protein